MINKEIEKINDDFSKFNDWSDKYNYLIELGNNLPPLEDQYKSEEYLIKGCQALVWLKAEHVNGRVKFYGDSDTLLTKGMIALLIKILSDKTPDEILNTDLTVLNEIGLKEFLSPTRSNGLVNMIKRMRYFADDEM